MEPITFRTADGKSYHLEVERLNPNIISGGSPGRIRRIAEYLEDVEVEEGERGMTVVHGTYEDVSVSAFPTGMGPASAAIVIPEAIESAVEGPLTILRLGTAGSLQKHVKVGDMAVVSGAIRDEGTTRAVVGPEFPSLANPELIPVILAVARGHGWRLGENLWTGIVHVKDDLYFKETPQFSPSKELLRPRLKSYRRMGAIASSMEFTVYTMMRDFYEGRRKGRILTGGMLAIIASAEEEEPMEVDEEKKKKLVDSMIEIGLDVLVAVDRLRKGKGADLGLTDVIADMIRSPSRFELK